MSGTLLDTGPLVAFLNRNDRWRGKAFTLDVHFRRYRWHGRQAILLLAPE